VLSGKVPGRETDGNGLPFFKHPGLIQAHCRSRPGELTSRWMTFLGLVTPFMSSVIGEFTTDRLRDERTQGGGARCMREILEKLGLTFVKPGPVLSIRPDIVGPQRWRSSRSVAGLVAEVR